MGIYNQHSIEYILLLSDKFATIDILKILKDNSIFLIIKRNEDTNERYIILTNLTCTDKRLTDSNYYKDNSKKWIDDYKSYTKKITEDIDIELNDKEKNFLNKILNIMPEMIESYGWYNENSVSTTYGSEYFTSLEYYLIIKPESDKDYIKSSIKEICNKLNYQVCDFVKVKDNDELQIKVVNSIQLKERLQKSKWFREKIFQDGIYRIKLNIDETYDIELTIKEKHILNEFKNKLRDFIQSEGWYLEVNIYNQNLFSY